MAQTFPYTYYACNCSSSNTPGSAAKRAPQIETDADEEGVTFDPRNPRSNYALFPLEHLLYCAECHEIRCPRCVFEETLNWYCPNCLFEVPSSVVKSDGNRCTRNCFNCPVCISPMTVSSIENPDAPSASGGPYILACPYCHWSTVETGIEFEKHTGVHGQLAKISNGGNAIPTQKERDKERERRKEQESRKPLGLPPAEDSPLTDTTENRLDASRDDLFSNLGAFYKSQLEGQTPSNPFSPHDLNFSSPSAYSRIMNLYSSTSAKKQKRGKVAPMREAASDLEGLVVHDAASDAAAIERIKKDGWSSTLSQTQKLAQPDPDIQFEDALRPVATLLCTKRSKRCRSCRNIVSKPESKITSTRYKIKLLALSHIPRLSLRALPATNPSVPPTPGGSSTSQTPFSYSSLRSGIATHFVLQLSNPLFDSIRVTLATPSTTPGRVQTRVTILCPQFEVGANTDVWDDALSSSAPSEKRGTTADGQIEAGKVWERGRNWTSVVIEVIPGFLKPISGFGEQQEELEEDDDLLEIPIHVRIVFETEPNADEKGLGDSRGSKGEKVVKEKDFWTVVGVGRVAPM